MTSYHILVVLTRNPGGAWKLSFSSPLSRVDAEDNRYCNQSHRIIQRVATKTDNSNSVMCNMCLEAYTTTYRL